MAAQLGLLADVQFADVEDGRSFHGVPRFYRDAKLKLREAVRAMASQGVGDIVHCGDLIDGRARERASACMEECLAEFASSSARAFFAIGNHDIYRITKEVLLPMLGMGDGKGYYAFNLGGETDCGVRVIVLDSFEVGTHGRPKDDETFRLAMELLRANNPNKDWNGSEGMEGVDKRWVMYNGALGLAQLRWAEEECRAAEARKQRVVLVTHVPVCPRDTHFDSLAWDYKAALSVLAHSPAVVAVVSGHDHEGWYECDRTGVHHIVLPGIVELPPGQQAFAVLHASRVPSTGRPSLGLEPFGQAASRVGLLAGPLSTPRANLFDGLMGAGARRSPSRAPLGGLCVGPVPVCEAGDDTPSPSGPSPSTSDGSDAFPGLTPGAIDWSDAGLLAQDLTDFVRVDDASEKPAIHVVSAQLSLGDLLDPVFVEGRWAGPPSPHCRGHVAHAPKAEARSESDAAAAAGAASSGGAVVACHPAPADVVVNCSLGAASVSQLVMRGNPKLSRLALPTSLWRAVAASLELLDASGCGLTALPDAIGELACLRHLDVSNNALTAVPEWMGGLPALRRLSLRGTPVACGGEFLLACRSLAWVDLTGCPIAQASGCTGICGPELCRALEANGCEVMREE